ncbi:DUF547 domain-containing protein [Rubripirellula tenax]|nr:DUF547 domain-containing protein [Rubripirellula tenax]
MLNRNRPLTTVMLPLLAAVAFSIGTDASARAGAKVYVGQKVDSSISMDAVDHSAWTSLLKKFVNPLGRVDYRGWKSSAGDIRSLDAYLATLSTASLTQKSSKNATLAFWINAYNAVTVRGILREYPTTSIRNHTAKLFGYNIWKDLLLHVGGSTVSLDAIEHQKLRPMGDPRIHFAIVCASIGCPRLLDEAYEADRLDGQLDEAARGFFSLSMNLRYDDRSNAFELSSIMDWFGQDFGDGDSAVLKRIAPWIPSGPAKDSATRGTSSIRYMNYDWSLNEQ